MMLIGLTGTIGSGKSTVAHMLKKSGIPIIDADAIAHELTQKGSHALQDIVNAFGLEIMNNDGSLNRKMLGQLVFRDHKRLKDLEAILHPLIEQRRKELIETYSKAGHDIVVYMAPLIFEKGLYHTMSKTILVVADEDVIKNRLAKRDQLTKEEAEDRIKAQMSTAEKIKLADETINNNGTMEDLYINLTRVWKKITGKSLSYQA